MPVTGTYTVSGSVQSRTYGIATTVNSNAALQTDESCVPGNAGVLTTRTNTTDGTITANSNAHTITSNTVVDLYWAAGSRRGVDAGTVSGTSIPISGGQGDNLPVANTNVTVATVAEVATSIVGANVQAITVDVSGTVDGQYSLMAGSTEVLGGRLYAGADYIWFSGNGVTNPVTGNTITKVRYSQGGTSANNTTRGTIQYN